MGQAYTSNPYRKGTPNYYKVQKQIKPKPTSTIKKYFKLPTTSKTEKYFKLPTTPQQETKPKPTSTIKKYFKPNTIPQINANKNTTKSLITEPKKVDSVLEIVDKTTGKSKGYRGGGGKTYTTPDEAIKSLGGTPGQTQRVTGGDDFGIDITPIPTPQQEIKPRILDPTTTKLKTLSLNETIQESNKLTEIARQFTGKNLTPIPTPPPDKFNLLEKQFFEQKLSNLSEKKLYDKQIKEITTIDKTIQKTDEQLTTTINNFKKNYSGKTLEQKKYEQAQKELEKIRQLEAKINTDINYRAGLYNRTLNNYEDLKNTTTKLYKNYNDLQQQRFYAKLILPDQSKPDETKFTPLATIGKPTTKTDITEDEYKIKLSNIEKEIIEETSYKTTVIDPIIKKAGQMSKKGQAGLYRLDLFNNPFTETISLGYDLLTGTGGYILASGKASRLVGTTPQIEKYFKPKTPPLINPKEASLMDYKKRSITELQSDYYAGKQLAETSMFLYGGTPYKIAHIGSLSRAKNIDELTIPLLLGAGTRLINPKVTPKIISLIGKANTKTKNIITTTEKLLGKKQLPVEKGVIVPSKIDQLFTESNVAKGMLLTGGGLEIIGMEFTPLEQKEEYLKNVGLFNAGTPLGYKATDIGITLGKYAGIKSLITGFRTAKKLGFDNIKGFDDFQAKDLMEESTWSKFETDGGGTPIFRGTEKEMLLQAQINKRGVGKVFEEYDFNPRQQGVGSGIRSVKGNLDSTITAQRGFYESLGDYYSPQLHPIALQDVGLKNKLFKQTGHIYDRYVLGQQKSSAIFTTAKKGVAVSVFPDQPLDFDVYKSLNKFYGYKDLDISFSEDVLFRKNMVNQGKILSEFEYEKILKKGRPIKTGDVLGIGLSDEAYKAHFILDDFQAKDIQGFVSTRPRAFGTTSESEFLLPMNTVSKRITPITKSKAFFRKLGFADAYVDVGFDYVPMNYYNIVETPKDIKLLTSGKKLLDITQKQLPTKQNLITTTKSKTLKLKKQDFLIKQNNITHKGKGGYTMELENVFGSKQNPKIDVLGRTTPKIMFDNTKTKYITPKRPTPKYLTPTIIKPKQYKLPSYKPLNYSHKQYKLPSYKPLKRPTPKYNMTNYKPTNYKPLNYNPPDYKPPRYTPPKTPPPRINNKLIIPIDIKTNKSKQKTGKKFKLTNQTRLKKFWKTKKINTKFINNKD